MARFYFDVRDRRGFHRDEVGEEFGSVENAVAKAQTLLPDIAREEMPDGDWHDLSCDVRVDGGRVVYQADLTFRGRRFAADVEM